MTKNPPFVVIGHGHASARISVLAGPAQPRHIRSYNPESPKRPSLDLETAAGKAAVYDVRMQRKSQLVLNPETQRIFVYVYRGSAMIGKKTKLCQGDFAVLEEKSNLPLVIDSCGVHIESPDKPDYNFGDFTQFEEHACWCLVLAGDPVMEPGSMLSSGIVACSPREIRKAFQEYTCGSIGAGSPLASSPLKSWIKTMEQSDESSDDNDNEHDPPIEEDTPDIGFGPLYQ